MFNTFITIACVLVSMWVVTMIVLMFIDIWRERGEWRKEDEQEKEDDYYG